MKGWRLGDRERAEGKKQWKRKFYEKLRRRKETGRLGGWCNFEPEGSSLTKQSSLCTLVHVCTHTHTRTRTRNTLFYTQPHAGGTNKASVPICCAPGLLSGDSQTGIQPCQHWHWSHSHTHTHIYVYVCESSHLHFASLLLQALHYQDFACLYVFLHFHSPRETDVRNLGECLQHCGDFYRRKTE